MVYTGEVVSGNGGHYNQLALQQDGVYSTEYELVGPHSSCNNTVLEFDNPLYSDRGPVTITENELVSLTYCFAYCVCIHVYPMDMYTPWEFYTKLMSSPPLIASCHSLVYSYVFCRLKHLLLQQCIPMSLLP